MIIIYKIMAKKSQRVLFDEEDYDFIQEYKIDHGVGFQEFVRDAIKEKIRKIETIEQLNNLDKLK